MLSLFTRILTPVAAPPSWANLAGRPVLHNPPLVAEVATQHYLHLDGANRLSALRRMGCAYALVQVIKARLSYA